MEETEKKPVPPKDGVQGIFMIGCSKKILNQKFVLVQDHDNRGTGTKIRKCGLPGGAIEPGEDEWTAFLRETEEEIALVLQESSFEKIGCFTKLRPGGFTNENNLFKVRLDYSPKCVTNDPKEVSKVHKFTLAKIIFLAQKGQIHEGSIRLLLHFLNGTTSGSLNEPVTWNGFTF